MESTDLFLLKGQSCASYAYFSTYEICLETTLRAGK